MEDREHMTEMTEDRTETRSEEQGTSQDQGLIPVDAKWLQAAFFFGLLIWLIYLLYTARGWPWVDKLFPYIVGIPTSILLFVQLAKIFFPEQYEKVTPKTNTESATSNKETDKLQESYEEATESGADKRPKTERDRYALYMIGWAIALPVLMYAIGFANALPLFVFGFGLHFYDDLIRPIVMTVVFSVLIYVFFVMIIEIQPWDGILGLPSILSLF
jgi:fatty acid desaturase